MLITGSTPARRSAMAAGLKIKIPVAGNKRYRTYVMQAYRSLQPRRKRNAYASQTIVRPPPAAHIRVGSGDLYRLVHDWCIAQWLCQSGRIAVPDEESYFETVG